MGKAKECVDHLGNKFKSETEMCKAHGINLLTFRNRISKGLSIEEALDNNKIARGRKVRDHKGIEYKSVKSLCDEYGIDKGTLNSRLNTGWTLEEALTIPTGCVKNKVKDHLGNEYNTLDDMYKAYGKNRMLVKNRIRRGMSLGDALTKEISKGRVVYDHLGNKYESVRDICKAYGIEISYWYEKLRAGWAVEEILNKKAVKTYIEDPDGNGFQSFEDMCRAHGIEGWRVREKLKVGISLREALDKTIEINKEKSWICPRGNKYRSLKEMCKAYNIAEDTVYARRKHGYDIDICFLPELKRVYITLLYIGLNGKSYYRISWSNIPVTARQIIEYYRPDLLEDYDRCNPEGLYRPFKPDQKRLEEKAC